MPAQKIATGNVGDAVFRHDAAGLSAFASANGSKQDEVEGRHCTLESIIGQ
jgi:hypothetical protein